MLNNIRQRSGCKRSTKVKIKSRGKCGFFYIQRIFFIFLTWTFPSGIFLLFFCFISLKDKMSQSFPRYFNLIFFRQKEKQKRNVLTLSFIYKKQQTHTHTLFSRVSFSFFAFYARVCKVFSVNYKFSFSF